MKHTVVGRVEKPRSQRTKSIHHAAFKLKNPEVFCQLSPARWFNNGTSIHTGTLQIPDATTAVRHKPELPCLRSSLVLDKAQNCFECEDLLAGVGNELEVFRFRPTVSHLKPMVRRKTLVKSSTCCEVRAAVGGSFIEIEANCLALVRQIGKHQSEVLTLGVPDEQGNVILLRPIQDVPLGGKLY